MKFFRGVTDNLKPISLNPFEVVSVEGTAPFWSVMTTHGARTIKFDGDLMTELEACANKPVPEAQWKPLSDFTPMTPGTTETPKKRTK